MQLLKKFIDLILYGNFWIASCALAFYFQTTYLLNCYFDWTALAGLTFFSTFFLYAIHRVVGINKLKQFVDVDRYHVIAHFKPHIQFYAFMTGIASVYYFFKIDWIIQLALIIPGILSLAYVLPILGDQKRLRDLAYIKIFLIAIVWSWVTVILPALEFNAFYSLPIALMALERAFFVFAITIPFDIRDLKVDEFSEVPTIPYKIGVAKSKQLGLLCVFIFALFGFANFWIGFYTWKTILTLLLSALTTAFMIQQSDPEKDDYFYSGLLDGSMLFQFLMVYGASCFL